MHPTAVMESRVHIGGPRAWVERAAAGGAALIVAAILGFYVLRLLGPLPLFAADAGAYLIHALYPDEMTVRDPYLTAITNGTHLSLIRAAYRIGAATGASYMLIDKAANAALYLGGLLTLWWTSARRLAVREQAVLLILALGFAYYRFPFSNMAEGPFVGAMALVLLITWAWYRRRPVVHALAAAVASALMVLAKPHGIATVVALALVALLDAGLRREWARLALRVGLFAVTFIAAGNLIQHAAQEPVTHPLGFFMSAFYEGALGQRSPEHVGALGLQALAISTFAAAILAGTPVVLGLLELAARWRVAGRALQLRARDLVFLTLVASLGATLAMVAIFAMKVASTPSETYRLWGRYFEFFAPMLWLAAAPAVAQRPSRGAALACGAVTLVSLSGLLSLLQNGWIVLPWDSAVLTAFFAPDPVRAPLGLTLPLRAIAAAATLLAAIAYALRAPPAVVGCALTLTLSVVSTWLDQVWLSDLARHRAALNLDLHAIGPALPAEPARVALITPDINVGHLGFLQLKARPYVIVGDPAAPPPGALEGADAVVASGDKAPPGAWMVAYRGRELSLWRPANASPLRMSR
jgi:hypothetical protein